MRKVHGFSLIELLASVAIIGVLATVAVPFVETTVKREKERDLKIALRDLRQAIDDYKAAGINGNIEIKPEQSGYPPSLLDLAVGIDDLKHAGHKLYFIRRIPRDPFNTNNDIAAPDTWGVRSFQSPVEAPVRGDDVFDVYSLSDKRGLNGIPYAQW